MTKRTSTQSLSEQQSQAEESDACRSVKRRILRPWTETEMAEYRARCAAREAELDRLFGPAVTA